MQLFSLKIGQRKLLLTQLSLKLARRPIILQSMLQLVFPALRANLESENLVFMCLPQKCFFFVEKVFVSTAQNCPFERVGVHTIIRVYLGLLRSVLLGSLLLSQDVALTHSKPLNFTSKSDHLNPQVSIKLTQLGSKWVKNGPPSSSRNADSDYELRNASSCPGKFSVRKTVLVGKSLKIDIFLVFSYKILRNGLLGLKFSRKLPHDPLKMIQFH